MPINTRERLLFRRRAAKKKRLARLITVSSVLLLGTAGLAIAANRLFFQTTSQVAATPSIATDLPTATPSIATDLPPVEASSPEASDAISPTVTPDSSTALTRDTLVYNLTQPPDLRKSAELQSIVDNAVNLAEEKGLPTDKLAITLIDAKTNEIAGYRQTEPRYPASVVKLFWLVEFYAQKEAGILSEDAIATKQISDTIEYSDNDTSAAILDRISGVKSQPELSSEKFEVWLQNRLQVNRFFTKAGYKNLNINQKTYPVSSQNMSSPRGTELQIRQVPNLPQRNEISTDHVARLLYEVCFIKEAVSPTASEKMCSLLTRDLKLKTWRKQTRGFHPIYGLLGEAFPNRDIIFASKAGGTSTSRQDGAFITTKDGKVAYILSVFGNDRAYAGDGSIFPAISRQVFAKMQERSLQ
jgi:beta-lactamase class A